jgi:hypothetical protein
MVFPLLVSESSRRWRRPLVIGGAGLTILIGILAVVFRPRYIRTQVPSGNSYDIIQVGVDSGIAGLFPSVKQEPALLVNYYARMNDEEEAREIRDFAAPMARERHLHLIVIQQTTPILGRWLPFVHGQMLAYHLVVGQWQLAH